jgi:glycerol uptake operon antiterminator
MSVNQKILPAISNHSDLRKFLTTSLEYGILMNFQLAQLPELIKLMKEHQKKVLIHAELIKGLSSDEFGTIYLIQVLGVDGIISSKPKAMEVCKKRGVIGIFRLFIRDSISFEQSMSVAKSITPEYLEILPASATDIIEEVHRNLTAKILMGGMIKNRHDVERCLQAGAIAITTSNPELWSLNNLI